jgi:acetate kinase
MGLTPLEGLVMGTRAGNLDPGLLIYLQNVEKLSADDLDTLLNTQSGMLGVSGRSSDVRELEQAAEGGDARARLALAMFAYRVRQYIGAYAATLGGVDAVAFAGGIGEHSVAMRARICDGLSFLGIALDPRANARGDGHEALRISGPQASVDVWVIPTNEELEIAREVIGILAKPAQGRDLERD